MIIQLSFMYFFIASLQVYILPGMSLLKKKEKKRAQLLISLRKTLNGFNLYNLA